MAISLKNIEDRVKTLENTIKSNTKVIKTLWKGVKSGTGKITLVEPMSNFDIVVVEYFGTSYIARDFIVPSFITKDSNGTYSFGHTPGRTTNQITASSLSSTTVEITYSQSSYYQIIGLKLYYNFSYNIIYKILSSIKFNISQIISSPKITRR